MARASIEDPLKVNRPVEFLEFTFEQDTRAVDQALAALGT